jgi:hypothetical protein
MRGFGNRETVAEGLRAHQRFRAWKAGFEKDGLHGLRRFERLPRFPRLVNLHDHSAAIGESKPEHSSHARDPEEDVGDVRPELLTAETRDALLDLLGVARADTNSSTKRPGYGLWR